MTALSMRMEESAPARPRLGFVGLGWIGLARMHAVLDAGAADAVAIVEPQAELRDKAAEACPEARTAASFEDLPFGELDGVVIATPSAMHAEQARAALEAGVAVFCQKPLARTQEEASAVVEAARRADRLLGVDLCYRHTAGMKRISELIAAGELGDIFAADLVFHNAYGPDKPWFYDMELSGGGCLIDLGVHLIDLAMWTLGSTDATGIASRLIKDGRPLQGASEVEDFARVSFLLGGRTSVDLTCSWNLHAGREAEISATFYGTRGGARFRNVEGSFYDFVAERFSGTRTEPLTAGPDEWGGRAIVEWAERLSAGEGFDPAAADYLALAGLLDRAYGRQGY